MSRVTVEDCILKIPNRFELVLMAAKRAKDIERGAKPSVPKDNDKATVIALREIAEETISIEGLRALAKNNILDDEKSGVFGEAADEEFFDLKELVADDEDEDDAELDDDLDVLQSIDDVLEETE